MITKKYLFFVSVIYGYIVGSGFYGYSNDYYAEYYQSNLLYPNFYDKLGSLMSTLTIFGTHIGVYLTSFILSLSTGYILKSFFEIKEKYSFIIFSFIFLVTIHVHPIIMSTSGAMRQGWAMSCIFFSIALILKDKNKLSFLFIFFAIFMHKSGLIFFFIYLVNYFSFFLFKKLNNSSFNLFLLLCIGIFAFISTSYGSYLIGYSEIDHRIVAGDFRFGWLVLNIFYIIFYFFTFNKQLSLEIKRVCLFLYIFSCSAPGLLLMGLNWQYERVNMVVGIILILVVSLFLKKNSFYLYLTLAMCTYLFLTIYQGMYTIGLT